MRQPYTLRVTPEMHDQVTMVHDWVAYGSGPMFGAWSGWRVSGDDLVSPCGQRISKAMIERFLVEASIRGVRLSSRGVKGPPAPSVTRTRGQPGASNVVPMSAPPEAEPPSAPR